MRSESVEEYEEAQFDPELVTNLNKITDKTEAKIVISSSWRKTRSISELIDLFKRVNITGEVIGKTESIYVPNVKTPRGLEIYKWLKDNNYEPHKFRSYVIIDDDSDMLFSQRNNFFNTDWQFGLGRNYAYRIINFLNAK